MSLFVHQTFRALNLGKTPLLHTPMGTLDRYANFCRPARQGASPWRQPKSWAMSPAMTRSPKSGWPNCWAPRRKPCSANENVTSSQPASGRKSTGESCTANGGMTNG
nr:MAG TPA: hypothetical protein [Caudoviricetes sp.]